MESLDDTTTAVYRYIEGHWQKHGFAPTLREIATECHLSAAGVLPHLDKLEQAGYVSREPASARTIRILKPLADTRSTTQAIYDFIAGHIAETEGEAPSHSELAEAFHLSTATIRMHLKRLEDAGRIERQKHVSRSILLKK